jgi:hypothetical protein
VSNTYQKKSRRAQPDPVPAEVACDEDLRRILNVSGIAAANC